MTNSKYKVLILAGGFGTRLGGETLTIPKPMVEIGNKPLIWYIMKHYASYGYNDFIVLLGYKGYVLKEYFANYFLHNSNLSVELKTGAIEYQKSISEDWRVQLIDTGIDSMTGGRIKQVQSLIKEETFLLTYGDGVSDIDINKLVQFHKQQQSICTVSGVQPEGRFGSLNIDSRSKKVNSFEEKPKGNGKWINAGFFVCQTEIFDYIKNDQTIFEKDPLQQLATENQLSVYKHSGLWQCMDTPRDKKKLESLLFKNEIN